MSKTKKGSKNKAKFRNKLARKYPKVSRLFVKTLLSKQPGG